MRQAFLGLITVVMAHTAMAASHAVADDNVKLYQSPNSKQVITNLPASSHLVPIFRQGDWLKVGNRANGQTGWVNIKQYRAARERYLQPDVQTVFIHTERNHSGKPVINIVAYKDGKKLSDKEAKALYSRMAKEQRQQQRYWRHFNHMMQIQERDMDNLLNDNLMEMSPPLVLEPGPVMPSKHSVGQQRK